MSYVKPTEVLNAMVEAGIAKATLRAFQMVVCGYLAEAICNKDAYVPSEKSVLNTAEISSV
ncbi:hypothetical protein MHH56_21075 [Paenibacillus sp. FSL K6-3182]|uniref:hypothetical protein n=1 Tax=unclassified Paenibacillus TaxID=185978 RepID=UPI0030CB6DFA